jgi:uncharacterized membrane protein
LHPPVRIPLLRAARAFIVLVAIATLATIALLWPTDVRERFAEVVQPSDRAVVTGIDDRPCGATVSDRCVRVKIRLKSGPDAGADGVIQWNANGVDPPVHVGDELRVAQAQEVPGYETPGTTTYQLVDFERGTQLIVLFALFAAVVLLLSRLRGALSLLALAVSLLAVLVYIIPAILDGKPPVAVAISGSLAIGLLAIALSHGRGPLALAAMLGTVASLLLTALLAVVFTETARLTGLGSEEAFALRLADPSVSLQGLLIAGMIIGALGVLDDVTVSQSSTVFALRAANPDLSFRELFRRGLAVGRDHVAATVNTLVLAYAGSSLPVLLVFASGALPVGEALVGSIGLIAAVPSTTALAALLARHTPREELAHAATHGHAHHH